MKHPDREEWVPFLFGEAAGEERSRLRKHLRECPECRLQVEAWRTTVRRLDRWQLPRVCWWPELLVPSLRWAVLVILTLAIGVAAGRLSATPAVTAEVLTSALENSRKEEQKAFLLLISDLQRVNDARYLSLRRDLETVASVADREIRQAQLGLVRLANSTPRETGTLLEPTP